MLARVGISTSHLAVDQGFDHFGDGIMANMRNIVVGIQNGVPLDSYMYETQLRWQK